jgi:hypothetical protein
MREPMASRGGKRVDAITLCFWAILLTNVVIVGFRLRFGSLPISAFFIVACVAAFFVLQHLLDGRAIDTIIAINILLLGFTALLMVFDIVRYGDYIEERLFFSIHRIVPIFLFLFLYLNKERFAEPKFIGQLGWAVVAGLVIYSFATILSALFSELLQPVLKLAEWIDAKSETAGSARTTVMHGYGFVFLRTSGLLKYPTVNAGFIATLAALAFLIYRRTGRMLLLAAGLLGFMACLVSFSRAGAVVIGFAFLLLVAFELARPRSAGSYLPIVAIGAGFLLVLPVLGWLGSEDFLTLVARRMETLGEIEGDASLQSKLTLAQKFLDIVWRENFLIGYLGEGLNNFHLQGRDLYRFDEAATGFSSVSWLLFMYDYGFAGALILYLFVAGFSFQAIQKNSSVLIFLLPLYIIVGSDNFFAITFHMHALMWVCFGLVAILAETEPRHADASAGAVDSGPVAGGRRI